MIPIKAAKKSKVYKLIIATITAAPNKPTQGEHKQSFHSTYIETEASYSPSKHCLVISDSDVVGR